METGHEYGSLCVLDVKIMWNWVNIHGNRYGFSSTEVIIMQKFIIKLLFSLNFSRWICC